MEHKFTGKWITNAEFAALEPRCVFHRQLNKVSLPCDEHRNRHVLFRRKFTLNEAPSDAKIFISADDYYKLYINGKFVTQGPTPSYHLRYNYNTVDVTGFLTEGDNVIAVHTLYQGLVNRVWQSGDNRHGLICDVIADGECVLASDGSFLTAYHTAYTEMGTCGYDTQFLERYDSRAAECTFYECDFDDSRWETALPRLYDDYALRSQKTKMIVFEKIAPSEVRREKNHIFIDFGAMYVGYIEARAKGHAGDVITVKCAQELTPDGALRHAIRANCNYSEEWVLTEGESTLDWFDYKSFRYASIELPEGAELTDISLSARHYPFTLSATLNPSLDGDEDIKKIWELCLHSQKYGVQEVIQDCMEREKGFYLGDGCYTALTHMLLSGDDSMVRCLIDDAFATDFITDTLVTCMDCSFMQEIGEFPLILVFLVLWHYRLTGDMEYLAENYKKTVKLLDAYKREYEHEGLLRELDKWCVVEWPANFRDGYDVDLTEGQVCHDAHAVINAYYIEAIRCANTMAKALALPEYRDLCELHNTFIRTFYDSERGVFKDGEHTAHSSIVTNAFAYGFGLFPDEESRARFEKEIAHRGISTLSLFSTFPTMVGFIKYGRRDLIRQALLDGGAWLRIIREGGTATFEGWGKDTKWNTSLFHLTMSYAAAFMTDADLHSLFA